MIHHPINRPATYDSAYQRMAKGPKDTITGSMAGKGRASKGGMGRDHSEVCPRKNRSALYRPQAREGRYLPLAGDFPGKPAAGGFDTGEIRGEIGSFFLSE